MGHQGNTGMEDGAASLFQPDPLIPSQYLATLKRKAYQEAEKELMLAVLEDAVHCFQNYFVSQARRWRILFRETEAWFFAKEESDWPFSYENICEVLGINPDYLRRGLKQWEAGMRASKNRCGRSGTPVEKDCQKRKYRRSA